MKSNLLNEEYLINYNNRKFYSVLNTDNGEVSDRTIFNYHQENNIIWAEYSGGEIVKGLLIGISDKIGNLIFTYQHVNTQNHIRTGKCKSMPEIMPDGKIKLIEEWEWTNGDMSKGSSVVMEI